MVKSKSNEIVAVLLDYDGTLAKTEHAITLYCFIARMLGFKNTKEEERRIRENWGAPWNEFRNAVWPGICLDKFDKIYNWLKIDKLPTYPIGEAFATLEILKAKIPFVGLISSRERESLIATSGEAGFDFSIFDIVQAGDDYQHKKPNFEVHRPALELMKEKGVRSGKFIYCGDTKGDAKSIRGIDGLLISLEMTGIEAEFYGVETGFASKRAFKKEGVPFKNVLKNINELPKALGII